MSDYMDMDEVARRLEARGVASLFDNVRRGIYIMVVGDDTLGPVLVRDGKHVMVRGESVIGHESDFVTLTDQTVDEVADIVIARLK